MKHEKKDNETPEKLSDLTPGDAEQVEPQSETGAVTPDQASQEAPSPRETEPEPASGDGETPRAGEEKSPKKKSRKEKKKRKKKELSPEKRRKKRRSNFGTVLLLLIFIVGLGVLLYPTISDYWNSRVQSRAIQSYDAALADLTEEDYAEYFDAADDYNERLRNTRNAFFEPRLVTGYKKCLDFTGTGIMGYINIEKINVSLPIYHTTAEEVLQIAVGHLQGTSLPTGGFGNHVVLSAHRGLPSARLFTDLDRLVVGDTFTITVLNRVLTYQIDQIRIVLPNEVDELQIAEGKDYCTLMTCTPYGVNSHRILIRGARIETLEQKEEVIVHSDAQTVDPISVIPMVAMPILLALLAYLMIKYRKKD